MYSGTTLTRHSGKLLGAHQKIDRVARKHLSAVTNGASGFPSTKHILQFEGKNGPDGIKRKSPGKDEPWHYYDPYDEEDSGLLELIKEHYDELIIQLKKGNKEKSGFEAAWLSHAIVDGLTPAHHQPYEKDLEKLRGEGMETRNSIKSKLVIPGDSPYKLVRNNWKMWGPRGLFTTHGFFELGIASILAPLRLNQAKPTKQDINHLQEIGPMEWFKHAARRVAGLDLYQHYFDKGWSPLLASKVRRDLAPEVVRAVCLFWYSALHEAQLENVESDT